MIISVNLEVLENESIGTTKEVRIYRNELNDKPYICVIGELLFMV